ncbi:MAG: class 1b ribonucleoside-diphosphate reductase subunit beta [Eubacteriales bacterium]|nr:class 1b ribonucleoside-diphosphate reductase subunit beta [Eubacteriales bacterium]
MTKFEGLREMKKTYDTQKRQYTGANWNEHEDAFTQAFYEQNLSQFWRPEDISLQSDLNVWNILPEEIQTAYAQNLLVLTFLDTYQGDIGMPVVARSMDDNGHHQRKSVLNFMAAMENAVHAKSYSNIFMTYLKNTDIDELYEWGNLNGTLQEILDSIVGYYRELDRYNYLRAYAEEGAYDPLAFKIAQYKAMAASVFLETCLFYSGFYYPLYFYGQGKLMQAGEIINLILRDESVHGLYVGKLAQEIYEESFDEKTQAEMKTFVYELLEHLYALQCRLSELVYDPVELSHDVKIFVRYNANKALMNLGFEPHFPYEEVNPVVLNGLNTETKTMDNFSMKGNGYQKMKSEEVRDEDFIFDF